MPELLIGHAESCLRVSRIRAVAIKLLDVLNLKNHALDSFRPFPIIVTLISTESSHRRAPLINVLSDLECLRHPTRDKHSQTNFPHLP